MTDERGERGPIPVVHRPAAARTSRSKCRTAPTVSTTGTGAGGGSGRGRRTGCPVLRRAHEQSRWNHAHGPTPDPDSGTTSRPHLHHNHHPAIPAHNGHPSSAIARARARCISLHLAQPSSSHPGTTPHAAPHHNPTHHHIMQNITSISTSRPRQPALHHLIRTNTHRSRS